MTKPIYKQGKQIKSIADFDQCESTFYKWNGKTVHRSVLISLQYRTLMLAIMRGQLFVAEREADGK